MRIPVRAYTYDDMFKKANPPAGLGVSEAFHTQFYDTQTFPAAAPVTTLNFFQTTNQDVSLSNMQAAGQFPSPQFFQLYAMAFEVLQPATDEGAAGDGAWYDVINQRIVSRSFLELSISDKSYGRIPTRACHPTGGTTGFGYNLAQATTSHVQYANGAPLDGGFWADGAIWFPPNTNFNVRLTYGNPIALTNAGGPDLLVRVVLDGVLHRRIL